MPHAWRSPARSPGSPRACATEPPPIRPAIADAFVDRAPIDWDALLARVRDPRERAPLEALRRLDGLRGQRATALPPGRDRRVALLRVIAALAASQIVVALAQVASAIWTSGFVPASGSRVFVVIAFAAAGLLLASASARDRRVLLLLATFTLAASAFARPVALGAGDGAIAASLVFRGLFPETFVPAALWQFAVLFPAVQRFTRFDVWARRIAAGVWTVASAIFIVNLIGAYGIAVPLARLLYRDDPGNLFWHLFAIAAVPAFAAIFVRAHRAPPNERRKAVRLGCALAAGAAPLLLMGLARLMLPDVNRWMLSAAGAGRATVDAVTIGALAAMPLMATLAVIVDRPFDLQSVAPSRLRAWLAGSGIRVAEIVHTRSLRPVRRRAWLTAALDQVRGASGVADVRAIVCRELQFGVGAGRVRIEAREDLPAGSALTAMLEESPAPVSLPRDAEPFVLLPARDREWLESNGVVLAAPIRLRDGTLAAVALLGEPRGGGSYDRTDRWFIATLLTGAAAAWEIQDVRPGGEDVAYECGACGRVSAARVCRDCGWAAHAALVPRTLAGKFEIVRRCGAGGMGVVYLARDTALARDVALKTLPIRRSEGVARLRDEARAMATLNHDGLATIYGLEVWRGTPVLVVEYFAGGTLAGVLARGPLSRHEAVGLGIRLAEALAYMHDRGFLHRDVKPSNIGFTADGVAKLLDFGLSDAGGQAAGTPGYLPPEVLSGAPPDAAVDLWGLAVVLLQAIRDHDPGLAAFFARALAPSPADRFQSARDLAAALHQLRGQTRV